MRNQDHGGWFLFNGMGDIKTRISNFETHHGFLNVRIK
jgi:hypothetical protein